MRPVPTCMPVHAGIILLVISGVVLMSACEIMMNLLGLFGKRSRFVHAKLVIDV